MSSSSAAAAPRPDKPAPITRTFLVDKMNSGRRLWLVKVPDVVAEIASSAEARCDVLGRFLSAPAPVAPYARKRPRAHFSLQLDSARVEEVLGAERAAHTPLRFNFTLEAPTLGARILTSDGGAYSFTGFASSSGTIVSGPGFAGARCAVRGGELHLADAAES